MKNGLALCAMVLFLLSLAFGHSSALPLPQRIALPNVDGRMDHMGIDIAGQRLFATAFDNHTLSVIDHRVMLSGELSDIRRYRGSTVASKSTPAIPEMKSLQSAKQPLNELVLPSVS